MISVTLKDLSLIFEASPSVFSPHSVDAGTLAMLSVTEFRPTDKVLDLGCGYGVVGILAAKILGMDKVVMCDISQQAVDCARQNAILNHVPDIDIRLSDGFPHTMQIFLSQNILLKEAFKNWSWAESLLW